MDGKCVFPFKHKNLIIHDCVKLKAKHSWCSLNKTYEGYWKYCNKEDFAKCVFPFWFRRLIYWECTDDGDVFGRKWCSLTRNYNKDRIWKFCD
ncbi:binder of sperm protein homolog 1 [Otolemur garnettii]|uniref:binder of sperm protein homolog 1 n=1 Tax=Otolemur garnettii TaxID=30611 RepID=UPI000C7E953E|nr:binder of sperm protein homolog 1 [Otolemur garnettii]